VYAEKCAEESEAFEGKVPKARRSRAQAPAGVAFSDSPPTDASEHVPSGRFAVRPSASDDIPRIGRRVDKNTHGWKGCQLPLK